MFNDRVFVPPTLRSEVLQFFHEGHPGVSAMKTMARALIWYHGLDTDIEDLVNSCHICKIIRYKPPETSNVS